MYTDSDRIALLAEAFASDDERLTGLQRYADLALPLAFSIHYEIVDPTPRALELIREAFDLLLEISSTTKDSAASSLSQLLGETKPTAVKSDDAAGGFTLESGGNSFSAALPKRSTSGIASPTPGGEGLAGEDPDSLLRFPRDQKAEPQGDRAHLYRWASAWQAYPSSVMAWFAQFGAESVDDVSGRLGFSGPDPYVKVTNDEAHIVANIVTTLDEIGQPVGDETSPLSRSLRAALKSHGVVWEEDQPAIGVTADGKVTRVAGLAPSRLRAPFMNGFGTRMFVEFSVHRDDAGRERLLCLTPALVATRVVDQPSWSEEVNVAQFASHALYSVDVWNPSTSRLMELSRDLSYTALQPEQHPRPIVVFDRQAALITPLSEKAAKRFGLTSQTGVTGIDAVHPTVARMGWLLPPVTEDQLTAILPHMTNGLVALSTIIEDGYRNFTEDGDPLTFDAALGSECHVTGGVSPGRSAKGFARWLPASLVGDLVAETVATGTLAYPSAGAQNRSELLERVALDGVGHSVVNFTNTLAFSVLFPQRRFTEAERFLRRTARMEAGEQQTNAISNLGIALFEQGRLDEAESEFAAALTRPDAFAEAEASYYLALIHRERGAESLADEYEKRCRAVGGYEPWHAQARGQATL